MSVAEMSITRQQVIDRLLALPDEIWGAEQAVMLADLDVREANRELEDEQARLLLGQVDGCVIDGKNAEQRAAQLGQYLTEERNKLDSAKLALDSRRIKLHHLQNEFAALRSVARLMGGGE